MPEEKCICSKEPLGFLPIMRIIERLDALYAKNENEEAGRVLDYWLKEAEELGDEKGLLEILSEQVGYFRKISDRERGLAAVERALKLLEANGASDSAASATIYLNCATTMKAFGKTEDAMPYYHNARRVYERILQKDDFRLAGLYNNMATAYAELKKYGVAKELYSKALKILASKESECGESAVTYVNMAQMLYEEGADNDTDTEAECERYMEAAYACLNKCSVRDGNYAFICSKCAPAFDFFGYFIEAEQLRKRAGEIYARA